MVKTGQKMVNVVFECPLTLEYGIKVHVRLLIFGKFSHLYALIPACMFIDLCKCENLYNKLCLTMDV